MNWKHGGPVSSSLIDSISFADNQWLALIGYDKDARTITLKTKNTLSLWEGTMAGTTGTLSFTGTVKENNQTYTDIFTSDTKVDISQRALEYRTTASLLGTNDTKIAITGEFHEIATANITSTNYPALTPDQISAFTVAITNTVPNVDNLTVSVTASLKSVLEAHVGANNPSFDWAEVGSLSAFISLDDPNWANISVGAVFTQNFGPDSFSFPGNYSIAGEFDFSLTKRLKAKIQYPFYNQYPAAGEPVSLIGAVPKLTFSLSFDF